MQSRLYALFCAILCKRRGHLWILVSMGSLGTNPLSVLRDNWSQVSGESKGTCGFLTVQGLVSLTPALFKGLLYLFYKVSFLLLWQILSYFSRNHSDIISLRKPFCSSILYDTVASMRTIVLYSYLQDLPQCLNIVDV